MAASVREMLAFAADRTIEAEVEAWRDAANLIDNEDNNAVELVEANSSTWERFGRISSRCEPGSFAHLPEISRFLAL